MGYYNSYVTGGRLELPALRIQYKDFAAWQQKQLGIEDKDGTEGTEGAAVHRSYWLEQLGGELPVLELPADKVRPPVLTHNGYGVSTVISRELEEGLRALCQRENGTLFMGLLGALEVLLYRYTGQEDIIIGSPVAGREHAELENQIGFYLNTLALRTRFSGDESWTALLARVREMTLSAYEHQMYPFDRLAGELDLKRDMSRSALFDVFLNLENMADRTGVTQGVVRETVRSMGGEEIVEMGPAISKFDLLFNLFEEKEGLSLYLEFNRDIYSLSTIERMIMHYKQLLRSIVAEPGKPISQLEYLLAEERREILEDFNDTAVCYDREETVMDLFGGVVERRRDRVAVRYGEAALSYGELAAMSQGVSEYLRQRYGTGRGHLVGIRLERSEWAVAVILGVLGSGAGYVPIDPGYPQGRIDYIIEDSGCGVVIDEEELEKIKAAVLKGQKQKDRRGKRSESQEGADWPAAGIGWGERAYVIYTSGSTGKPKGVEISHGNLYNYVRYGMWRYFGGDGGSGDGGNGDGGSGDGGSTNGGSGEKIYKAPLFTSLSFDLTVTSIFCTLLSGGELMVYGSERGVGEVLEEIFHGDRGINVVKCTPGHLRLLGMSGDGEKGMSGDGEKGMSRERETTVEGVIVGGEALTGEDVGVLRRMRRAGGMEGMQQTGETEEIREMGANIRIYNEYGPTETTVGCVVAEIEGGEERIPVGKPIWNTKVYIVDGELRLVGKKITGEICIGGAGVGLGYLNKAELTAERFVANPYREGERMYRTGDLGRWREDGTIEYLGRMDDQVKIRGYRIELGEVEQALKGYPEIKDAIVIAKTIHSSDKELVAYIICKDATGLNVNMLNQHLQGVLPEYMIPRVHFLLEEFPLTANGKIDRNKLVMMEGGPVETKPRKYADPDNQTQKKLVEIWQKVLELSEEPCITDSFFELGGNSIKAIKILSRVSKEFGIVLNIKMMFQIPTIENLANEISNSKWFNTDGKKAKELSSDKIKM
jgi:non-ribosomal peptide synthetase component F/acyl carrier protein